MAYSAIGGFPPQQLPNICNRTDWVSKCKNSELETKEVPSIHREYSNHIFLVYMHVNKINGKIYIGITHHVNPNKRWGYSGQKYTHCKKFVHAIQKYGWENFKHIILCRTNKERAIAIEQTLIAYYKKLGISYNLSDGGEGANSITEENRIKLRERLRNNPPMKGKHHTPEARARISEANKKRIYTREQKEQLRKAAELGRKIMKERGWWLSEEGIKKLKEKLSKPVLQLDLEGNVIREFPSTRAADAFINNGKICNHIADVCNGKRKTANGYKWIYKEERRVV